MSIFHKTVHLSTFIGELSSCSRWQSIQRLTVEQSVQTKETVGFLVQNETYISHSLSYGSENILEEMAERW